jgi:hypothetical protein
MVYLFAVSFGGTVSFFLGCSVLSGVEFLYHFTLRLGCKFWAGHHKKSATDGPKAAQQLSKRITRPIALRDATDSTDIPWAQ